MYRVAREVNKVKDNPLFSRYRDRGSFTGSQSDNAISP